MRYNSLRFLGAFTMVTAWAAGTSEPLPVFSATGPDAAAYGAADHFPIGTADTMADKKYLVGAFSHFDKFFPTHPVAAAAQPWPFQRSATPPEIVYVHEGAHYTLQEYLSRVPVTGLLIAKDDQILYEGYQYGRTDRDAFTSQSIAKSITAMLVGIAVADRAIDAVTDPAGKYVPELKEAPYGKVAIRDLLHMASGVDCEAPGSVLDNLPTQVLAQYCKSQAPAGTRYRYSAADAQVLGIVVQHAVKMTLAQYLDAKIWKNIGTEASATWTTDTSGSETAYCCFNAVLRDYARFARLLAFDGAWGDKQLIPKQWLLDATTVKDNDSLLAPGHSVPFYGYGYQTWIFPGARRMFALIGANGQRIFVDPRSKLIMVQTAVMEKSIGPEDKETIGLWLSLVHRLGRE